MWSYSSALNCKSVPVRHKTQWVNLLHENVGRNFVELNILQKRVQNLKGAVSHFFQNLHPNALLK